MTPDEYIINLRQYTKDMISDFEDQLETYREGKMIACIAHAESTLAAYKDVLSHIEIYYDENY